MKRSGLVISTKALTLAALVLAACGGGGGGGGGGNDFSMKQLDGFVSTSCASDTDCTADACSVPACNGATHQCTSTAKSCTTANGCTITADTCVSATCDASSGSAVWNSVPMAEGQTCTTDGGAAGTCTSGTCSPIPSCYDPTNSVETVACGPDNASATVASNDPNDFANVGSAVVSSYTCAPNEAGPEVGFAFQLDPSFTAPVSVTVTLKLATVGQDEFGDETYTVATDQTTVDLDLIVLEGSCTGTATCANPSSGSVFQGITAGTSAERVTFMADPTQTYYFVVDGKDMNQVGSFIVEAESCGACALTPSTDISCNTSYPVDSTTMGGSTVLTNYTCGNSSPVAFAGTEVPFLFRDDSGVARSFTATLTGASMGTGLFVLNQASTGDCQGSDCITSAIVATDMASTAVTWSTNPVDEQFGEGAPPFSRNWLVVDRPDTATTTFGLTVACAPYCEFDQNDNALYCHDVNGDDDASTNDATTVGAPAQVTQWGSGAACGGLTGLTGPEDVITFAPSTSQHASTYTYTFELAGDTTQTQDLSLIILDGGATDAPACDPTAACATFSALSSSPTNPNATGTLTTDVAHHKVADVSLTAEFGHTYLLVVDGTGTTGSAFSLTVTGPDSFAGCN